MRRRAPGRSAHSHFAPVKPKHAAGHCRALVLVDGTAIRKKIKKDYEKALRDLERSRQQLDQFQKTDLPQFTRWLNGLFGTLLTELRELSQQIALDKALIFQVENEVMFRGGSYARAYKRVMDLRENPAPPPHGGNDHQGQAERGPFKASPGFEDGNFDSEADPLAELFDEIFGGFGPEDGQTGRNSGPRLRPDGQPAPPPPPARLKELYRKLVRHLHPDAQEEMTPQKTEWWHQAQAAYRTGDEDQLEVILTLCEIGDSGTTASTSATLLHRITAQLKSSLREIKRQLAGRRRDLAWNFSKRADRKVMEIQLREMMSHDLEAMRGHWRETQELIAGWQAGAERLKKPRRSKQQRQDTEFRF